MEAIKTFINKHPRLTAWFVLAVGMVTILLWSARDLVWAAEGEGFTPAQVIALIIATVLVAGLCVWIIGWEEEEEEEATLKKGKPEEETTSQTT